MIHYITKVRNETYNCGGLREGELRFLVSIKIIWYVRPSSSKRMMTFQGLGPPACM